MFSFASGEQGQRVDHQLADGARCQVAAKDGHAAKVRMVSRPVDQPSSNIGRPGPARVLSTIRNKAVDTRCTALAERQEGSSSSSVQTPTQRDRMVSPCSCQHCRPAPSHSSDMATELSVLHDPGSASTPAPVGTGCNKPLPTFAISAATFQQLHRGEKPAARPVPAYGPVRAWRRLSSPARRVGSRCPAPASVAASPNRRLTPSAPASAGWSRQAELVARLHADSALIAQAVSFSQQQQPRPAELFGLQRSPARAAHGPAPPPARTDRSQSPRGGRGPGRPPAPAGWRPAH